MQIADRFHMHQNLMEAVNKVLRKNIPAVTAIEEACEEREESDESISLPINNNDGKKNWFKC